MNRLDYSLVLHPVRIESHFDSGQQIGVCCLHSGHIAPVKHLSREAVHNILELVYAVQIDVTKATGQASCLGLPTIENGSHFVEWNGVHFML
jgi:hypothetical protein